MNQKGFALLGIISLITLFMSGIGYYLISAGTLFIPRSVNVGFLGNFDVNSSEDRIIFPFGKNGASNIYISKIDGNDANKINNTKGGNWPKFSHDGKKILFLTSPKDIGGRGRHEGFKNINVVNLDGSGLQKIEVNKIDRNINSVREPVWDQNGERIYFIGVIRQTSYSPDSLRDIYSINMNDLKINRITNQEFKSLNNLQINSLGNELNAVGWSDKGEGIMTLYGLQFSEIKYSKLNPEEAARDEREGFSGSSISFSSDKSKIVYTAPPADKPKYTYESDLYYSIDEKDSWQLSKRITNFYKYIHNAKLLKNDKILFLLYTNWEGKLSGDPKFDLMEVGLDGSGLKKIELSI